MNVGELKDLLKNIPDNVKIIIEDIGDFKSDFGVNEYKENDNSIKFILPTKIIEYEADYDFKNDIPQDIVTFGEDEYQSFLGDRNIIKVLDFVVLKRNDFLEKYRDVTDLDYDLTKYDFLMAEYFNLKLLLIRLENDKNKYLYPIYAEAIKEKMKKHLTKKY